MKKNGFTLAEVLITLAIIGVVATMTLPALMSNTGEQQAKTGLKKAINTLTEAGQMNSAVDNFNYAEVVSPGNINDTTSADTQSLYALFAKRLNVDFAINDNAAPINDANGNVHATQLAGMNNVLYLRDGSAIFFNGTQVGSANGAGTLQDDNLPLGYDVVYDTNGIKGPNILSNCVGNVTGAADVVLQNGGNPITGDACRTKSLRVIKDQFMIRLRGSQAVPSGAAAVWAFNN